MPGATRTANTVMALVMLLLLVHAAWQEMRISALKADLAQTERELAAAVERMASEKLQNRREEVVAAVSFVDDFYRSADGLQRPAGLYNSEAQRIDAEAIGTWVLDVYLQARIAGQSDGEARQSIADAIRLSDEWKRKHPGR